MVVKSLQFFFSNNLFAELEYPLEHYELELRDQVAAPGGSELLPVANLEGKTAAVRAVQLGQSSLVVVHRSILLGFHAVFCTAGQLCALPSMVSHRLGVKEVVKAGGMLWFWFRAALSA